MVTGIGFLGAGVMLARDGIVVGATSAATIWVLAAIGVCVAIGNLLVAIKFSIIVVVILICIELLERSSTAFTQGVHAKYKSWREKNS